MAWHWLEKLLALTCTLGIPGSCPISRHFTVQLIGLEQLPRHHLLGWRSSRFFQIFPDYHCTVSQYIIIILYNISSYCTLYMFLSYTIFYIYMCIYILLHWHCVRVLLPTPTATRLQSMKRSIELRRNKYTKEREAMSAPWTQHDATSKDRHAVHLWNKGSSIFTRYSVIRSVRDRNEAFEVLH